VRATESGTARLEWSAEVAAASGFLRTELADAQPIEKIAGGRKTVAFDGGGDSLEFTALPPAHLAAGGWHVLRLALEPGRGGGRLMLSWRLVRSDRAGDAVPAPRSSVLLDHVEAVEFNYFGVLVEGEPPGWHGRWQGAAALPALVRLRVSFVDGRHAPDLIVALRSAPPPWQPY